MTKPEPLERESPDAGSPIRASFSMNRQSREAIRWVAERYRVDQSDIVDIAPVLFTILAEQSLSRRKQRLDQLRTITEQAMRNVVDIGSLAPHLSPYARGLKEALIQLVEAERSSIESRQVSRGVIEAGESRGELYGLWCYGDCEDHLHQSRVNTPLENAMIEMVEKAGGVTQRDALGEDGEPACPHCMILAFDRDERERLAVRPGTFQCFVTDDSIEALVSDPNSFFPRLGA